MTEKITDFIFEMIKDPEIDSVVVVYKNHDGETTGMGSIKGVKDMHKCLKMLESYGETLRSAIPTIN